MSPVETSRYHCIFCTFIATDASKLRKHFEREHGRNSFFWCKWCGKAYSCLDELIDHLEKNLCDGTYDHPCGFEGCDYSDSEPARFIAHLKSFHKGKPLIPCKYCKRLFTLPPCLVTHLQDSCCNRPDAKNLPRTLPQSENKIVNVGNSSSSESKSSLTTSANTRSSNQTVSNTNATQSKPSSNTSANKKSARGRKPAKKPSKPLKKTKILPKKPQINDLSDSDVDDPTWNPIEEGNDSGDFNRSTKASKRGVASKEASSIDKRKLKEVDVEQNPPKKKKNEEGKVESVQINNWEEWQKTIQLYKSEEAYKELLKLENIKNFYKCMHKSCTFSSSDKMNFALHVLNTNHSDELHRCCYCLSSFSYIEEFMKHMVSEHGNRKWQCSACLYRSCSKGHIIFHQQTAHNEDDKATVLHCKLMEIEGFKRSSVLSSDSVAERNSYTCFVPDCSFSTFITDQFQDHISKEHSKIKTYKCCYCKFSTTTFEKLLRHFGEHDIYEFECSCCSFGAEKSDDVLRHICINHADSKVPVLSRTSKQEEPSPKPKKPNTSRNKNTVVESIELQTDDQSSESKDEAPIPKITKSKSPPKRKSDSKLVESQISDQQKKKVDDGIMDDVNDNTMDNDIDNTMDNDFDNTMDNDIDNTTDDDKPIENESNVQSGDFQISETEDRSNSQSTIPAESDELCGFSAYRQKLNKLNLKEVYITTREGVKIFSSDFKILFPSKVIMKVQDVRRFY